MKYTQLNAYHHQPNRPGEHKLGADQSRLRRYAQERTQTPDGQGQPDTVANLPWAQCEGTECSDEKREPSAREEAVKERYSDDGANGYPKQMTNVSCCNTETRSSGRGKDLHPSHSTGQKERAHSGRDEQIPSAEPFSSYACCDTAHKPCNADDSNRVEGNVRVDAVLHAVVLNVVLREPQCEGAKEDAASTIQGECEAA